MTSSDTELLINITRKAPWLTEEDKTFFPESAQEDVQQILGNINDYNLTIITECGRVFKQYLILRLKDDRVLIDKPFEWNDSVTSFHVFLEAGGIWNFFLVGRAKSDQTTISARIPDKIFFLQRRRYKRVLTPIGTKAIFKGYDNRFDSAHVLDISEGGMRICINSAKNKYPADSIINDIFITIPPKIIKDQANIAHRTTLLISNGKVVRIFYDQEHSISYYGISFFYNSVHVKESVRSLVAYRDKPSV